MVIVQTYHYQSNASFVISELSKLGIEANLVESQTDNLLLYNIEVRSPDQEKATQKINELKIDDSPVDPESSGYLERHEEWNSKMYVNGYYTGGKIPHYMLDKSRWHLIIPIFILTAIPLIIDFVRRGEISVWLIIYLITIISMILQYVNRKKKSQ